MTAKVVRSSQIEDLENSILWALQEYLYHCQSIKTGCEIRFKFTRDKSASYPAGLIRQFELIKIGEKLFFEVDNTRFEPKAYAVRLAKAYLDSRVYPVKQREAGGE